MNFFETEAGHILMTGIATFITGGGLVRLYNAYNRKEEKQAENISELSYQYRQDLSESLDLCKEESKKKDQKILDLSVENAKLKTKLNDKK